MLLEGLLLLPIIIAWLTAHVLSYSYHDPQRLLYIAANAIIPIGK